METGHFGSVASNFGLVFACELLYSKTTSAGTNVSPKTSNCMVLCFHRADAIILYILFFFHYFVIPSVSEHALLPAQGIAAMAVSTHKKKVVVSACMLKQRDLGRGIEANTKQMRRKRC